MVGLGRRNGMVGMPGPISAAVSTARTPGIARAALTSTLRMRPCATGLRTIAACHWPARSRSSTYCPRPRRNRRSSTRSTGLPMKVLTRLIALLHRTRERDRVTVGWRLSGRPDADIAAGAGAVVDKELLAEGFRKLLRQQARHDVRHATRCERNNDSDPTAWISDQSVLC